MKNRVFRRLSKKIVVLLLCCTLVSGACFSRYKITANATAAAATLTAYGAYEICLYLGTALAASCGVAAVIENRDELAELGKNFIDSMNLDEISGWVLTKVNTAGQSYVYGSEALKEVQKSDFTAIQGGGSSPENNDDNDGDGDVDADDRTAELKQMGIWATGYLYEILNEQIPALREKIQAGEENVISEALDIPAEAISNNLFFSGDYVLDENNDYFLNLVCYYDSSSKGIISQSVSSKVAACANYNGTFTTLAFYRLGTNGLNSYSLTYDWYYTSNGVRYTGSTSPTLAFKGSYACNFPVFASHQACLDYLKGGEVIDCLNYPKVYQIADWLQEEWTSALTQLNTGIRSLNDNMLIVGEAMNQALQNQLNGLGYVSALDEGVAGAVPMTLPGTIADPIYYPANPSVPALAPEDLPWYVPATSPDSGTDSGTTPGTEPTPDTNVDISGYAIDLRNLFPFCIPFDFIALLKVLNAEPEAPRFEIPFVVPSLGIEETYVIDLSMFDSQMEIIRVFELVSFVIGLMFLTGKVIKW